MLGRTGACARARWVQVDSCISPVYVDTHTTNNNTTARWLSKQSSAAPPALQPPSRQKSVEEKRNISHESDRLPPVSDALICGLTRRAHAVHSTGDTLFATNAYFSCIPVDKTHSCSLTAFATSPNIRLRVERACRYSMNAMWTRGGRKSSKRYLSTKLIPY